MLADIILKIAEDENREKGEHEYYARPSIAGPQRCIRQMVYWGLKTAKKPLPGRAVMKFSDSSFHEDLTADWIRKTAYKLHSEQMHVNIPSTLTFLPERICKFKIAGKECGQVIPAGHIAGHIDGILTDLIEQDTLWEHKAISHFSFGMFEKGEVLPLDNITQTVIYLKGLQLIQPEMRQGLLLIKNKNTAQYLEYLISYDSKRDLTFVHNLVSSTEGQKEINKELVGLTQQAFDKFALVQEHITSKTIPARQYDRNDWQCGYCPYGELCWEGWENEIEEMETDVALSEEFGTLLGHRQELSMHLSEMNKEKKILDKEIKRKLKEKGVRQGKVDKYTVELSIVEKKEHTVKASKYEKLSIRLKKEAKNGRL